MLTQAWRENRCIRLAPTLLSGFARLYQKLDAERAVVSCRIPRSDWRDIE